MSLQKVVSIKQKIALVLNKYSTNYSQIYASTVTSVFVKITVNKDVDRNYKILYKNFATFLKIQTFY